MKLINQRQGSLLGVFAISSYLLIDEGGWTLLFGLLGFTLASYSWILHTDHDRVDLTRYTRTNGPLPFWLYEAMPFVYLVAGLLCWRFADSYLYAPSIVMFLCGGFAALWTRRHQRLSRPRGRLMIGV